MLKKIYKNKLHLFLISLVFILILLKSYSGNYHSIYLHLWQYKLGLASFENDFYLKNTFLDQVSIIYNLFAFLKINLDNDYVGFLIHSLFLSLSAFFTLKIIIENFKININEAIIILFAVTLTGNFIIFGNKSSWLINHSATPTFFSHTIIPFFLWSLFNKRLLFLFLSSIFVLLVNIKASWFIVGVGIIYGLYLFKLKDNIWILGIIFCLIYLVSVSPNIITDFESKKFFFKNALERETLQAAYHMQPFYRLVILVLSFPLFFFLIKKIDIKHKLFFYILLFSSILTFVFFYIFAKFGYNLFPETGLLALSGTRALGMYEFFFFILLFIFIFQSKISKLNKTLILFLLYCFFSSSFLAFSSAGVVVILILLLKKTINNNFLQSILKYDFLFLILILPIWIYLALFKTNYDYYGLKKINKWTTGTLFYDKERLSNAIKLRKCEDFRTLDIEHPYIFSSISRKSNYMGDEAFNYFNKDVITESKISKNLLKTLKKRISNDQKIDSELLDDLYKKNVILIISEEFLNLFPADIYRFNLSNGDYLLLFLEKTSYTIFKNICLDKL
jgi:hypothetical protein